MSGSPSDEPMSTFVIAAIPTVQVAGFAGCLGIALFGQHDFDHPIAASIGRHNLIARQTHF